MTEQEEAFKVLYEAVYDLPKKTNVLFDALDKAAPFVAKINRELKTQPKDG